MIFKEVTLPWRRIIARTKSRDARVDIRKLDLVISVLFAVYSLSVTNKKQYADIQKDQESSDF